MGHKFAETTFTPAVRALQEVAGSRAGYAAMEAGHDTNARLGEREVSFISARDSFYMASVGESGWPYLQHRGGPTGFMKIIDDERIGFADFSGNRQYISTGNFQSDNRVALFFMDYPNRRRLKLLGRVEVISQSAASELLDETYLASVERGFVIHIEAFDWNCPQHITPRFTETEIQELVLDEGKQSSSHHEVANVLGNGPIELVVAGMRQLAPTIRGYELRSSDGSPLPEFSAGSHLRIPIQLPDGRLIEREYSIASNPALRDRYEIAVLLEAQGFGGSKAVHRSFDLGLRLHVDRPINLFPLDQNQKQVVLIAGGIGITPIRSMAFQLAQQGTPMDIHYAGRSRRDMAYLEELEAEFGSMLRAYSGDEGKRLDVEAIIAGMTTDTILYVCGPSRLIASFVQSAKAAGLSPNQIRYELFD